MPANMGVGNSVPMLASSRASPLLQNENGFQRHVTRGAGCGDSRAYSSRESSQRSVGTLEDVAMSEYFENRGLLRAWRALGYSLTGLRGAFRHESAFRQEVALAVVVVPLGLWLGQGGVEKALLAGSWLLVLIVELLNSAIEAAVDRFGPEQNELSGRAKDIASAAVLLSILLALLVWGLLLAD